MTLDLMRREGEWIVFNQQCFRQEVVAYFWGGRFQPNPTELYARSGNATTRNGHQLDLGDTHWALAATRFAARPQLYSSMLPEARRRLQSLRQNAPEVRPPSWVCTAAWRRFQPAPDGVHRYRNASPMRTDIILIKQNGALWAAYAEAPTDLRLLREQAGRLEPSVWRRAMLGDTPEDARIRWLADANRGYNQFMWRQVQSGIGPGQASRNYRDSVYQAYLRAFIPLIGGSAAAHPAGGAFAALFGAGE